MKKLEKLKRLNDYLETLEKDLFSMNKKELLEFNKNLKTFI
tara:strand:+ start:184 stop:306 length:123 start_codon:yes stop_codon:yes gene_type:complete